MNKPNKQEPVYKVKRQFLQYKKNLSSMLSIIWEIEKKKGIMFT